MADRRSLPNTWSLYHLSQSPYFQRELQAGPHSPRPLSLFVGRATELQELLGTILDVGDDGSVQGVAGALGVGKTTLVKELKGKSDCPSSDTAPRHRAPTRRGDTRPGS